MKTYEFYDNIHQNDMNDALKSDNNHIFVSAKCMLSSREM